MIYRSDGAKNADPGADGTRHHEARSTMKFYEFVRVCQQLITRFININYNFNLDCLLGNLSSKNRLRDRFFSSKSRQVTRQSFIGQNFRQESRTGFKERKQDL